MSQSTSWNPESYAKNARFVSDLGEPLLQLLNPRPGELILDLGCGDGALTRKIAACCRVIGVDSSFPQLQAAKERGINAIHMDGHQLSFKRRFDAVFSNAALHWMKQPETVVAGVTNSLKPAGRFIGEFGGRGNVERIRCALHDTLRRRAIDPLPSTRGITRPRKNIRSCFQEQASSLITSSLFPDRLNSLEISWIG